MENEKVTKEDQRFINEFSKLHQKNKTIDQEVKLLNEKLANLKDASSACDELFGESTKIMIGETFVELPEEIAKERIEKIQTETIQRKKEFDEKYVQNKKRLDELKIILYSKFGKSINLDE